MDGKCLDDWGVQLIEVEIIRFGLCMPMYMYSITVYVLHHFFSKSFTVGTVTDQTVCAMYMYVLLFDVKIFSFYMYLLSFISKCTYSTIIKSVLTLQNFWVYDTKHTTVDGKILAAKIFHHLNFCTICFVAITTQ